MRLWSTAVLASAVALGGCNNLLAKMNPCGGIYPVDGTATVSTRSVTGTVKAGATSYDLAAGDCDTLLSGTATDASGSATFDVECGSASLAFTLPDLRTLATGEHVDVAATLSADLSSSPAAGTAQLTVDAAEGSSSPAPAFVTSDFVRTVVLDLSVPATTDAAGSTLTVHVTINVVASDYTQGMTEGTDSCPDLPAK